MAQPSKALSSIAVGELAKVIESREEQFSNANIPMVVSELGKAIDLREEHPKNACWPMELMEFEKTIELSEEHLLKARVLMVVSELGKVTDLMEEHSSKASRPMEVIFIGAAGNLILPTARQPVDINSGDGDDFTYLYCVKKPSWMVVVVSAVCTSPFPSIRTYALLESGPGGVV